MFAAGRNLAQLIQGGLVVEDIQVYGVVRQLEVKWWGRRVLAINEMQGLIGDGVNALGIWRSRCTIQVA